MIGYFLSALLAVFLMYGLPIAGVWLWRGGHRAAIERVHSATPGRTL